VATWMLKSLVTEEDVVVRSGAGAGRVELMLELPGASKMAASTSRKLYLTETKMSGSRSSDRQTCDRAAEHPTPDRNIPGVSS
jgi:hypothetical protein